MLSLRRFIHYSQKQDQLDSLRSQRNKSVIIEVGGALLIVSQFTLAASLEKGRRPGFGRAAPPEEARGLYERFVQHARAVGVPVQCGQFGADMEVSLLNDGPVTYLLRSQDGQVRMP